MRKTDRNSLALEILDGALNPTKKCTRKRLERAWRLRTKANRGRESRHFDGIWRANASSRFTSRRRSTNCKCRGWLIPSRNDIGERVTRNGISCEWSEGISCLSTAKIASNVLKHCKIYFIYLVTYGSFITNLDRIMEMVKKKIQILFFVRKGDFPKMPPF